MITCDLLGIKIERFGRVLESKNNINVYRGTNGELLNVESIHFVYSTEYEAYGIVHKTLDGQGLILVGWDKETVYKAYKQYIKKIEV